MAPIAYVTDTEGQWPKLVAFCEDNPLVSLAGDRLELVDGATLVFGGDALDRGPAGQRLLAALLDVKLRHPDRVVLLGGNRDINKLRLLREVAPPPDARTLHHRVPPDIGTGPAGPLLRWTLAQTMSAPAAFDHRAAELSERGQPSDDEAVALSMIADVQPDGLLLRYLQQCQLAFRAGDTLFVHGAVTADNFGQVPGHATPVTDVDGWVAALNAFFAAGVAAAANGDADGYLAIVRYQAPTPGSKHNPHSVVYGRPTDAIGNPQLPAAAVIAALQAQGVQRLVLGHTPCGDCPGVLWSPGFDVVLADNSYSRLERGAQVLLDGATARVRGWVELDNGEQAEVAFTYDREAPGPLGLRQVGGDWLAKARLADGRVLLHCGLPGYQYSQVAMAEPLEGAWELATARG